MKKIQITITLLLLAGTLFPQVQNEQVTVIAPFQPTVLDAHKINVMPQTIDSVLRPREARFDILSRKVVTSFGMDHIRPARVAGEPLTKLSPLHVRGGFGNYATAYGELFYGSERSAQWQYGTHLKHHSSRGTFKNHEVPFDNSENLIKLFGSYFGKKAIVSTDFYYDRQRYSAYGADVPFLHYDSVTNDERFLKDEQYKLIYNNVGGNIGFSDNNTEPNSFGYSGNLAINMFQPNFDIRNPIWYFQPDYFNTKEWSVGFDGNTHQTFDFRHSIFNQTTIGLDVSFGWHKTNSSKDLVLVLPDDPLDGKTYQIDNGSKMLKFHPYGKLRFSGHDFSLGLRINTFDEVANDMYEIKTKTDFQLVPTLHAKFNLIDNLFAIEFGLDGNAEYLTSQKIVEANPFALLGKEVFLLYFGPYITQLHREYYLGLNTALSKAIDFSMKGKLVSYKRLLSFDAWRTYYLPNDNIYIGLPTPVPTPFFNSTYQDINCFQLQANLNYHLDEKIAISAMARANFYDDEILYKPKYEANLMARYNMQNKIILKTQLYVFAGTKYHDFSKIELITPKLETFKPIVDWSIGAEYRFNRRWSAFLDLNNILNQKYYHWYNYRSFRTNFIVGATFNL